MGARVTVSSAVPAEVVAALRAEQLEVVDGQGDLAIVAAEELAAHRVRPPVLALSARDEVVAAFAAGADDVVVVPADPREVAARAQAILRRTRRPEQRVELLRFADVVLDVTRHEAKRAGEPVVLTLREHDLLRYFLLNPRQVLSKRQILDAVWTSSGDPDPNLVETYVGYLRRKLGDPPLIRTVRHAGYVLDDD